MRVGGKTALCIDVYLTGFGEFRCTPENPTTDLINHFKTHGVPGVENVCKMEVLHVSVEKGGDQLRELHSSSSKDNVQLWLHLGVSGQAKRFCLENRAQNELDFQFPDECGKTACREKICAKTDGDLFCCLPLEEICTFLQENGFKDEVEISQDAEKCKPKYGLFLHVPPVEVIKIERQREFVAALLQKLVSVVESNMKLVESLD